MIPVNEPLLGDREQEYVLSCLRAGWISGEGPYIQEFERAWADYCGMPYGIAVSSGTAALHVALAALDLAPGSEVILPTFTIISCAQAVLAAGCRPVLVDCDEHTWCMDVAEAAARVTPRTRAIMPVHIYGHPADMDPLVELAQRHGLFVVEDAAEAHGARYKKRCVGGLGDLSCFSFYANKILTTGEGGMVLTRDAEHAERARSLRNLCFRSDRRFRHTELGHNYRLTNIQAALGVAQVEQIEDRVQRKQAMARQYQEQLHDLDQLQLPVEQPWATSVYWMYGVVLRDTVPFDAQEFAVRLREQGVDTRPFFLGMHEQPVFRKQQLFSGKFPVAERLARRGLYLPSGLTLSEADIARVAAGVRRALA